jgi:hypothetical protein
MPIYKNPPPSRARVDKQKVDNTKIMFGEEDAGIGKRRYICHRCNGLLDEITNKYGAEEYHCPQCRITTIPSIDKEDTRSVPEQDIEVPREPNEETLIANPKVLYSGNTFADKVAIRHEPDPKGSFKMLKDKGLRIVNYREEFPG